MELQMQGTLKNIETEAMERLIGRKVTGLIFLMLGL